MKKYVHKKAICLSKIRSSIVFSVFQYMQKYLANLIRWPILQLEKALLIHGHYYSISLLALTVSNSVYMNCGTRKGFPILVICRNRIVILLILLHFVIKASLHKIYSSLKISIFIVGRLGICILLWYIN